MHGQVYRAAAITLPALILATLAAAANPMQELPGRWSGWGKMQMQTGEVERLKCIATYIPESSSRLRHNLRCASSSYNIDLVAKMTLSSGQVTGEWEERTYVSNGGLTGKVTDNGLAMNISGGDFSGSMTVTTSKCRQSVSIAPRDKPISEISLSLAKC